MNGLQLTLFGILLLTQTSSSLNTDIFVYITRERLLPTWYNLKDPEGPQTSVKSQSWYLDLCSGSTASVVGSLSRKIYSDVIPGGIACVHGSVSSLRFVKSRQILTNKVRWDRSTKEKCFPPPSPLQASFSVLKVLLLLILGSFPQEKEASLSHGYRLYVHHLFPFCH